MRTDRLAFFLTVLFVLAGTAPAEARCLPLQDLPVIRKAINLPEDFKESDLCNPKTDSYKLWEALIFMKNNTFSRDKVPSRLNQNVVPASFWSYFTSLGKTLRNRGDAPACGTGTAYTQRYYKDEGVVNLCAEFYSDGKFLVERVASLLHEIRHFEVDHNHVACVHALNKTKTCDQGIGLGESNAVTVEAIAKMLFSGKLDAVNRAYGRYVILQYTTLSFVEPVYTPEPTAIYIATEDGRAFVFDGQQVLPSPVIVDAQVISRYVSLAAFPFDHSDTFTADLFSHELLKLPAAGWTSETYNKVPKDFRPTMIDIIVTNDMQTQVSSEQISVNGMTPLPLSWTPAHVFTAAELQSSETDTYYILDTEQKVHRVNWSKGPVTESVVASLPNLNFSAKAIVHFQDQRFALRTDGSLLIQGKDSKTWNAFKPLQGIKIKTITRPFLWQPALREEN